jgi:hypothetical protein
LRNRTRGRPGERAGSVRVKGSEVDPKAADNTAELVVGQPPAGGTGAGTADR